MCAFTRMLREQSVITKDALSDDPSKTCNR